MKRAHMVLAALLLGLALVSAGCGSGDGSEGDVASASGKGTDGAKGSSGASDDDPQARGLKFAQCMREHGIEMEDPKGGKITIQGSPGDSDAMQEAQEACQKYLPQGSAGGEKAAMEGALKFAQCMRKNGVAAFPDPKGGMMRMDQEVAEDPDFEAAQKACEKFMVLPGDEPGGDS